MNKHLSNNHLRVVTQDFSRDDTFATIPKNPMREIKINNLAASLVFLFDASEDRYLASLIGHGEEKSSEEAIQNWLRDRYHRYDGLSTNERLNKAGDDLIEFVCEITERY